MTRAIVSVAFSGWYPAGQDRLVASLDAVGYKGLRCMWRDELPPGSPTHGEEPYAFKVHAIQEAFYAGARYVLYLDASMYAVRSLEPVFNHIERKGYMIIRCGSHTCEKWCSDDCLNAARLGRDSVVSWPMVIAGCVGFDLQSRVGSIAFRHWIDSAKRNPEAWSGPHVNENFNVSRDPSCLGHRHDQSVLSLIVNLSRMSLVDAPMFYHWDPACATDETCIVSRGME
jgi:hypothetical protein